MLKELYIENLAVIARAAIPFDTKLNVFTGETGAGKSILIHGINAVLGQRVTKELVRTGCGRAVITALFTDLSDATRQVLDDLGISYEEDGITLTREILADGGSVARINQRTATVSALREIGSTLITIHGQHDNQILLEPERHLHILDAFGGDTSRLADYQDSFRELQSLARRLGTLRKAEQNQEQRMQYLRTLVRDVGALELASGEDAELEAEYQVLLHGKQIAQSLQNALALLNEPEAGLEQLQTAEEQLQDGAVLYPAMGTLAERMTAVRIETEDIASELSDLLDGLDLDGARFAQVSARRDAIAALKRRYQCDAEELLQKYEAAVQELQSYSSAAEEIRGLTEQKSALLQVVTEKAKALSNYRATLAKQFVQRVGQELAFLDMPQVQLAVQFTPGKLTMHGMETAEFLISANAGEPPKPIAKIASGGELSRMMLALKAVVGDRDEIPTMIFDEIDTGVSGRAAQKIGIKLRQIGSMRQVLCVTHLSQIAVMAEHHLLIEKRTVQNRTETSVTVLDFAGRVREIARIMGGENPSRLMLETAEAELRSAMQKP
ncbi:DNA repair protein RecN [Ruminococcus champanellensis]